MNAVQNRMDKSRQKVVILSLENNLGVKLVRADMKQTFGPGSHSNYVRNIHDTDLLALCRLGKVDPMHSTERNGHRKCHHNFLVKALDAPISFRMLISGFRSFDRNRHPSRFLRDAHARALVRERPKALRE
jgi:hypothetical protein